MVSIKSFLGGRESRRAQKIWQRIQERPAQISIERGRATTLAAQTVRVEYSAAEREVKEAGSASNERDVMIYGVVNHPDESIADTDIERGDRFVWNGQIWTVESIVHVRGGIQAKGVVSG